MNQTLYSRVTGIDDTEAQREIFEEYKTNPILARAISGEQPIEKSYERLRRRKIISLVIPRRKNPHNQEVENLAELVNGTDDLQIEGSFVREGRIIIPCNFASFVACVAPLVYGITNLGEWGLLEYLSAKAPDAIPPLLQFLGMMSSPEFAVAAGAAGGAGLLASTVPEQYTAKNGSDPIPQKEAKYLDSKIEELYRI